eukprot:GAHX01003465.1.p1 GENE.GAHX01003465.1~~GAHX01003465.1.p1  ORF type:complete len:166 (-),score=38.30 GAHX01003465.1:130-627(-)
MSIMLFYKERENAFERTYLIHGSFTNSFERMFGILIEHYRGNLPFLLSPFKICFVSKKDKILLKDLEEKLNSDQEIAYILEDALLLYEEETNDNIAEERKIDICENFEKYKTVVFISGKELGNEESFELWMNGKKQKCLSFVELGNILKRTADFSNYKLHDNLQV